MAQLIILVGNIGTGKTHYRKTQFNGNEVIVCPDEWINLGIELVQRKMITDIENGLKDNKTVILDGSNMKIKSREFFDGIIRKTNSTKKIIDFGQGTEKSLDGRIKASTNQTPEFWTRAHAHKKSIYEKPTLEECDELMAIN